MNTPKWASVGADFILLDIKPNGLKVSVASKADVIWSKV